RFSRMFCAPLRRLLYGYNTALTGLLLLAILALLNVTVYFSFPSSLDWTQTRGFYSLSSRTQNILENLKDRVSAYVILSRNTPAYQETRRLLDNCRGVTNKLQVTYLSPELQEQAIEKLKDKYPVLGTG